MPRRRSDRQLAAPLVCRSPLGALVVSRLCHASPYVTRAPPTSGEARRHLCAALASLLRLSWPLVAVATVATRLSNYCSFIFSLPWYFVDKLHICLAFLTYCILVLPLFKVHLISHLNLMILHEKLKKSINCMLVLLQCFSSVFF